MEILELTLTGHAYLGSSFGRDSEGRVVFVPYSIPGERVKIQITESHKRWARGEIIEILETSPERIEPRCQHFSECGGCHYQHFPYELQLEAKDEVLRSQLMQIGGFSDPPITETVPSPSPWNSRNHVQFSLDPNGKLGFRAAKSDHVVPITECHLPEVEINNLWPSLDISPIPGLDRIALRRGGPGEDLIVLHSSNNPEVEMELNLPTSVVWINDAGSFVMAGEGFFQTTISERLFRVSAASFFQVHTRLTPILVNQVLDAVDPQDGSTVFDLYAGVGLFSAFIAERGAKVIAVEQSHWATADFEHNLDEFETVELFEASVEEAIPSLPDNPDVILADPPRAGLGQGVVKGIVDHAPSRFVYVSCDPTTLARDGKALKQSGYTLRHVVPIDLFPQTFHIESMSIWEREVS
jgi:23S rRNA (uracil1939-C5)-methyltransferase